MKDRLALIFILVTVLIDAMGIGLIMPVMPDLLSEVRGGTLQEAAIWGGILSTSFAVMQFAFGPLLGNLSDAYGRRPVLLVSLVFMALDYLVMALAQSIWLLLAARIAGGITAATHSTAAAFIADISKPEEKAARFGLIGAAFGAGFFLGPAMGGLLGEFGTRAPFYAAAILSLLNLALGLFVLPETVTDKIRRPFRLIKANPFSTLTALGRLPGIARLMLLYFFYEFALLVYPTTWAFFGKARFDWSPGTIGLSLAIYGLSSVIVQAVVIRPVLARFKERRTVILGLGFEALALLILAFITSSPLALAMIPMAALGSLATPAMQAMMSVRVSDDEQGALQGAITSVRSVATIFSPLVMTAVFAYFAAPDAPVHLPGAAFLLALALMVAGGIVLVATPRARGPGAAQSG